MAILKNTYLKIEILSQGAELKSIKDMDGVEYLLDDHQFWGYTSPHLFPSIGALRNQEFTYKGQTYSLKKHGFARNMDFSIVSEDDKQITYEIQSTDETLKIYPFPFTLQVQYLLELDKRLFTIDTLLFKDLKSSFVSLKNRKDNKEVKLTISEFPFLGIWTTLGPSPFICFEPLIGHPDFEDEQGEFLEKEDSPHLGSYEEKSYSYHMDIL